MTDLSPEGDGQQQAMTRSYHEINDSEEITVPKPPFAEGGGPSLDQLDQKARKLFHKARHWVGDLSLEGVVTQEGEQVTYVAQDIGTKIRMASPTEGHAPSSHLRRDDAVSITPSGTVSEDLNVIISEVEVEAKKLASSVDTLTENLTGILHSLSSMTVDCTFVASDGVTQLCDTADASIKAMYQVMAKSEELNRAVQPIYRVHQQIKDTKRLLDKVELEMN